MSTTATPEEIWSILREAAAARKENEESFRETARQFQETDLRFQETDRQIKETGRQLKETDRQLKETDRKLKEVMTSLGRLGNKLGEFVEEMVKPAVVRLFRERGIEVHEVHRGVSAQRDEEWIEVDLLVVNDGDVVAVECKSTLGTADVDEHLERLAKLKRLLPSYRELRVIGAVAAMVMPDDVARYAYRKGLFVLAQSGENMVIRNAAGFKPATW